VIILRASRSKCVQNWCSISDGLTAPVEKGMLWVRFLSQVCFIEYVTHCGDIRGDLFDGLASRNMDGSSDLFLGCRADICAAAVPIGAAIPA
jgi:hypothetical protein